MSLSVRTTVVLLACGAGPTLAQDATVGVPATGETLFANRCMSCHVVANETGEVLAKGKTGPGLNLFGLVDRLPAFLGTAILPSWSPMPR